MTNQKTTEEPETKEVNSKLIDVLQLAFRWLDVNVLPLVSLAVLCGLAVVGLMTKLDHLSASAKLAASIALIAILAVKLRR